jgi:hypothetical protein
MTRCSHACIVAIPYRPSLSSAGSAAADSIWGLTIAMHRAKPASPGGRQCPRSCRRRPCLASPDALARRQVAQQRRRDHGAAAGGRADPSCNDDLGSDLRGQRRWAGAQPSMAPRSMAMVSWVGGDDRGRQGDAQVDQHGAAKIAASSPATASAAPAPYRRARQRRTGRPPPDHSSPPAAAGP